LLLDRRVRPDGQAIHRQQLQASSSPVRARPQDRQARVGHLARELVDLVDLGHHIVLLQEAVRRYCLVVGMESVRVGRRSQVAPDSLLAPVDHIGLVVHRDRDAGVVRHRLLVPEEDMDFPEVDMANDSHRTAARDAVGHRYRAELEQSHKPEPVRSLELLRKSLGSTCCSGEI